MFHELQKHHLYRISKTADDPAIGGRVVVFLGWRDATWFDYRINF